MRTVELVLRHALPRGTEVLAGEAALGREVSWAYALRVRGGFAEMEPGALAIIHLKTLGLMPARPSAAQAVQALGRVEVAAVALVGRLAAYQLPMTRLMADRVGCALLALPEGTTEVAELADQVNEYLASR